MKHNRRRRSFRIETVLGLTACLYTAVFLYLTIEIRSWIPPVWQTGPAGFVEWLGYLASFAVYWMTVLLYVFVGMIPLGFLAFTKETRNGVTKEWVNPLAGLAMAVLVAGGLWIPRTLIGFYD